jgi:malonyl-CoA decarboxylase
MSDPGPGLLDRTMRSFRRAWRLAGARRGALKDGVAPDLPKDDAERTRRQIDSCLEGRGGEVSARARAAELGEAYLVLDSTGRRRFLELLARDYDVDPARVDAAVAEREAATDAVARRRAEERLRETLVPPRIRLLSQFNDLSQGVKFLVDLRAELLDAARDDPTLRGLDRDLRSLLASWFDVGFLDLERITWDTPASLLEKFIEYEAVHAIRSWDDLKHRLEGDRRCYAFFHPRMPAEPIIFVQVALVNGIAASIQEVLDESGPTGDPEQADTAIFYSISNCQRGLAGVGFGSFLIKEVADDLSRQLPNIRTFCTLSPIPGFMGWLEERLHGEDRGEGSALLRAEDHAALESLAGGAKGDDALAAILAREGWWQDPALAEILREPLQRLCARYLLEERRGERARDRVAHFHLSNGARVERINWLGDTSSKGLAESAGMMVNFLYKLSDVEKNHEAYADNGRVAAASAVRKLLKA